MKNNRNERSAPPQKSARNNMNWRHSASGKRDYWDSIADDVATGYGATKDARENILNDDQLPGDERRGDE